MIEEGRWVDPAQRAVQVKRGQREGQGEALRQDDLKDIARRDIVFRAGDHIAVAPVG